tara:strand:+ start:5931 stop:6728 length:798 start_codon:yes stop_codon:yes gene_type:complete
MNINIAFKFLRSLPIKLNLFYQHKTKAGIFIMNKSGSKKNFDPVTNIDKSFEKFIRHLISKKFSNHSIAGEEYLDKKSSNKFKWYVDPIDGTKAFIIGVPTWSNLIGLTYENQPLLGLANFPELKKFYINDKSKSYLFLDHRKYICKSSNNSNIKKAKIIGNFNGLLNFKEQQGLNKSLNWSLRLGRYDALSYCLLAQGKVDAVIETKLKKFDILPIIPIIKNSGAIITNWRGESANLGGNILATSNGKLHKKILQLLKPYGKRK